MRKISVQLDERSEKALFELIDKNGCSISDVVNIAIITMNEEHDSIPSFEQSKLKELKALVKDTKWRTIDNWCEERAIQKTRLHYVLRSLSAGKSTWGLGNNKNKWRDQEDDRVYKTHTSWIAHCLSKDFDIQF